MPGDLRQEIVDLLPRMRRFAYALSGSLDEADDLVQAACERALSRLDQFESGTRLDSWLFRIVQTTWIDRLRSVKRRAPVNEPEALEAVGFDDRIHERTEARAALQIVRAAIAELPEEQRSVIALCAIDDLTYQEAADILAVPIGTVMSRLARARKKLASALESGPAGILARQREKS
jgi:RNA polymerase sigma-70 factor, ECF subfamily